MTHEARSAKAHSSFHLQCGNWELPLKKLQNSIREFCNLQARPKANRKKK